jgi:pimeloyl-ACP methyl ester carboxylesterase
MNAGGRGDRGASARARMLAGVPGAERAVRFGGVRTTILEAGDGPPLVLLHGGIECGGPVWAPTIGGLAERRRVIVPDLPGLGASDAVDDLVEVFGDWLRDLVSQTCSEPPALVAHSLGGSLVAGLIPRVGGLLRGLVLYGAPALGPYRLPLGLRLVAMRFALRPTPQNSERFERWAFHDYDAYRARNGRWLDAFGDEGRARARDPRVRRAMRRLIASGIKRVPDAELDRMRVPTELIWGRHDRFVPLSLAEGASLRLDWPLHVIDDAGHVPHIERPGAFVRTLESALERWQAATTAA